MTESCKGVLWRSVIEKRWKVVWGSVVEKCCEGVLLRSVVVKCLRRVL